MYIVVVLMVSSLHIKVVNVYQKMQKVTAAAKKRFTSRFTSGINIFMPCLNFIRLLQVVFSSQQRLNRPAVKPSRVSKTTILKIKFFQPMNTLIMSTFPLTN